jgi:hypothetical protein
MVSSKSRVRMQPCQIKMSRALIFIFIPIVSVAQAALPGLVLRTVRHKRRGTNTTAAPVEVLSVTHAPRTASRFPPSVSQFLFAFAIAATMTWAVFPQPHRP